VIFAACLAVSVRAGESMIVVDYGPGKLAAVVRGSPGGRLMCNGAGGRGARRFLGRLQPASLVEVCAYDDLAVSALTVNGVAGKRRTPDGAHQRGLYRRPARGTAVQPVGAHWMDMLSCLAPLGPGTATRRLQ
jgi:hypothetical protein